MQKFTSRKVYVFFFSVLVFMLHLPVAFSSTKPLIFKTSDNPVSSVINNIVSRTEYFAALYNNMDLSVMGLSEDAFNYAMKGFDNLVNNGKIGNTRIITIVDFTKPSSKKRMYVIDVLNEKVLFYTYVAHGQKSGKEFANQFSNIPESYQSSLGFYETSTTYTGKNGYSMKLKGLENGINNKAEERAVVVHGAPYVSESFINTKGYLGRSWGCPALPEKLNKPIIDKIKNGTCLFIYSKNDNYLNKSRVLNS
ncbi:MAG: murein L,D-transpeptidase catalytic domain family protein [Ferruginibacter sp.]